MEVLQTMNNLKENYNVMFTKYPDVVNIVQMLGGIGISLSYRLLRQGKIQAIKIGREYKIPKTSIISYLTENK